MRCVIKILVLIGLILPLQAWSGSHDLMELHAQAGPVYQGDDLTDHDHSHDDFSSSLHQLIDHDHNPAQLVYFSPGTAISFEESAHDLRTDKHPQWLNDGLIRPPRSEIL